MRTLTRLPILLWPKVFSGWIEFSRFDTAYGDGGNGWGNGGGGDGLRGGDGLSNGDGRGDGGWGDGR
jgi:hypothetical protein